MVVSLSSAKTTEKIYSSSQGSVRVQVCNSRMVRITKSINNSFPADEPWMVVKYDFDKVDCQWSEDGDAHVIKTADMVIRLTPNPR